jgi:hypothetical protein
MDKSEENKSFSFFKKLLFKEEFLEQPTEKSAESKKEVKKSVETAQTTEIKPAQNTNPISENVANTELPNKADSNELMEKIYAAIKKLNQPGIDFLELWDAMEAMGGVNVANLKNSFVALKIASGNALTKEIIIETGNKYLSTISGQLQTDISSKEAEELLLKNELADKKTELENRRNALLEQIKSLQTELNQVETSLGNIDESYVSKFDTIKSKINSGKNAQQTITNEIKSIIHLVEQNL